jgi:peroxiredoxin
MVASRSPAPVAGEAPAASASPASTPPAPLEDAPAPAGGQRVIDDSLTGVIDQPAPPWQVSQWFNSPPLTLEQLRGKVVLVRWFMGPSCPFCSATAASLRALDERYASKGLTVIGMYHHKEETPFDPAVYEQTARKYEFTFPLAVDPDWRTLQSWMRDRAGNPVSTGFTSVTFLLDKRGVIRHVHPGGQYVDGDPAHAELQAAIERLLAEP